MFGLRNIMATPVPFNMALRQLDLRTEDSVVPPRYSSAFNNLRYNNETGLATYSFWNNYKTYYRPILPFQWYNWKNDFSLGQHYNRFVKRGSIPVRMMPNY